MYALMITRGSSGGINIELNVFMKPARVGRVSVFGEKIYAKFFENIQQMRDTLKVGK